MCSDSTTVSRDIWSDGTDTAVFHPLTAPKNSAGVTNARVGWRVFRDTGGQELRAGVQYGNDGVSWDTASEFDRRAATEARPNRRFAAVQSRPTEPTERRLDGRFDRRAATEAGPNRRSPAV